ncbi:Fur-regulated basic protein FbpA [Metabacillus sp. RGM 3146]
MNARVFQETDQQLYSFTFSELETLSR